MLWTRIIALPECKSATPPSNFSGLFLLKNSDNTHWLIGQYKHLTRFATALRHDNLLRDFVSAHRIRIGLRGTDVPPSNGERQQNYATTIRGENSGVDFSPQRLCLVARPVCELKPLPTNRKSDREENVKAFWESQTPQSHHIVEFNNLESLGVSRKDGNEETDYYQLPAVLLATEFHQRYISAILRPTHAWRKAKLEAQMSVVYRDLYLKRSILFEAMWSVSRLILEQAGLGNRHFEHNAVDSFEKNESLMNKA